MLFRSADLAVSVSEMLRLVRSVFRVKRRQREHMRLQRSEKQRADSVPWGRTRVHKQERANPTFRKRRCHESHFEPPGHHSDQCWLQGQRALILQQSSTNLQATIGRIG